MHAWGCPSSSAILITHCQTLQLSGCGSGFFRLTFLLNWSMSRRVRSPLWADMAGGVCYSILFLKWNRDNCYKHTCSVCEPRTSCSVSPAPHFRCLVTPFPNIHSTLNCQLIYVFIQVLVWSRWNASGTLCWFLINVVLRPVTFLQTAEPLIFIQIQG